MQPAPLKRTERQRRRDRVEVVGIESGSRKQHGKTTRYTLFGHAVTAVIRWMGVKGFTFDQAVAALEESGCCPNPATVKIQLSAGLKGERGAPASLSREHAAQLLTFRV